MLIQSWCLTVTRNRWLGVSVLLIVVCQHLYSESFLLIRFEMSYRSEGESTKENVKMVRKLHRRCLTVLLIGYSPLGFCVRCPHQPPDRNRLPERSPSSNPSTGSSSLPSFLHLPDRGGVQISCSIFRNLSWRRCGSTRSRGRSINLLMPKN